MAETLDEIIEAIIVRARTIENIDFEADATEQYFRAAFNEFAATLITMTLPDDPVAQEAVVRKAQALGVDFDGEYGERKPPVRATAPRPSAEIKPFPSRKK